MSTRKTLFHPKPPYLLRRNQTMSTTKRFSNATGAPVTDNTNIMTAGPRSGTTAGHLADREDGSLRSRSDPRAPHARQGLGAYGTRRRIGNDLRHNRAPV
jgi:catalase